MRRAVKRDVRFRPSSIGAAVALALSGPAAIAQQVDNPLESIVVTATKRAENIETVPLSITAISGDDLIDTGVGSVLSLDKLVPGLKVNNSGNDPVAILRGAGVAGTTDTAVPYYVDGVYRPLSSQGLASFLDIDKVEVLRGPQGTLFGRNTYGGLINITTKRPSMATFDAGGALTVGDYAERRAEGFLNIPLDKTLAFRFTGSVEKHDPFVVNTFDASAGLKDADNRYGRAQVFWRPGDAFSANLTATYWHDTANGNSDYGYKCLGIPVNASTHQLDGVTGFLDLRCGQRTGWAGGKPQAGNISNGDVSALASTNPYQVAFDYRPHRDIEENSQQLLLNWDVAGHTLTVNAAHFNYRELRLTDGDLSFNSALVSGQLTNSHAHSVELTLNSKFEGPLKYTLGAYLYDDSGSGNNSAFLFGYTYTSPQRPSWAYWLYQGNGGTKSTALYGQASYSLTDKLTATAGLRDSKDERKFFTLNVDQGTLNSALPIFDGTAKPDNGYASHADWRTALEYQLNKHTMFYLSGATGYIAGSTQAVTDKLLPPQTSKSYEAGVKMTVDRLTVNAALFLARYSGLTTTVFVTKGSTILSQQVPGGSTKAHGLELDGQFSATPQLFFTFGIAADTSKFDRFNVSNTLGTAGSSFVDSSGHGWFIMDGQKTAFSPDLTANIGTKYHFDLGSRGSLTPEVSTSYSSSFRATNEPYFWSV